MLYCGKCDGWRRSWYKCDEKEFIAIAMNMLYRVSEGVGCAAVTARTGDGESGRLAAAAVFGLVDTAGADVAIVVTWLLLEGEGATDEAVMDEGEG